MPQPGRKRIARRDEYVYNRKAGIRYDIRGVNISHAYNKRSAVAEMAAVLHNSNSEQIRCVSFREKLGDKRASWFDHKSYNGKKTRMFRRHFIAQTMGPAL